MNSNATTKQLHTSGFSVLVSSWLGFVFDFSRNLTRTVAKSKSLLSAACVSNNFRTSSGAQASEGKSFWLLYCFFYVEGKGCENLKKTRLDEKLIQKRAARYSRRYYESQKLGYVQRVIMNWFCLRGFPRCKNL